MISQKRFQPAQVNHIPFEDPMSPSKYSNRNDEEIPNKNQVSYNRLRTQQTAMAVHNQ